MMKSTTGKRILLVLVLLLALLVLSSCYMEPDRTVDDTGLNNNNQTFDTILTPTPAPTATPTMAIITPTPTANTVDWSDWNFGNDTATNPPSSVTVTVPPQQNVSQGQAATMPPSGGNTSSVTPVPATSTPKKATPTPTPASTTLKLGSTGSAVKKMQQRLKDLGYYSGSVDGTFGSGTESSVKAFQKAHGLTADGKAGNNTLNKLYSSSAKKASVTATATPKKTTNNYTNGKTNIYLQLNSTGKNVTYMQNRLIELGYLTGKANGTFNASTEVAVKAFQKAHKLWDDGVAGPSTLEMLYSSKAKKASSAAATLGSLKEGSTGSAVRTLQSNLKKLGYYNGSVDGDYGAGTTSAVAAFQSAHGLKADGIAGQSTLNKISEELGGGGGGGSTSSTDPTEYGKAASSGSYKTLTKGSSKSKVSSLQAVLYTNGYYNGTVDGDFGSSTIAAVKDYQKAAGLRVTGMAGPTTQRLLFGDASESGSYSKLEPGSSGSKVKQLQYALYELKYYDGKITGSYDTSTENAVMEFQERNNLYIDGIAGQDTQRRLFSSNAVPSN